MSELLWEIKAISELLLWEKIVLVVLFVICLFAFFLFIYTNKMYKIRYFSIYYSANYDKGQTAGSIEFQSQGFPSKKEINEMIIKNCKVTIENPVFILTEFSKKDFNSFIKK